MLHQQNQAELGLGLAALGRPGYINLGHDGALGVDKSVDALRRNAFTVLDAAWAGGIRYFDAARSYGQAEAFLGDWLGRRKVQPDDVFVASKWGYSYTAGWQVAAEQHEVKDHSLEHLQRQYAESRALLGQHLRLYQIHSATQDSGVMENNAVLDDLMRLKLEGVSIGFTSSGPQQADTIRRALQIERDGRLLFDTVQATWNLLEPSADTALAEAKAAGLRVIVKEALANGRLAKRNEKSGPGDQQSPLESVASQLGGTLDALALAAALAQPWADIVLSGATTTAHLQSNFASRRMSPSKQQLTNLTGMTIPPKHYWQQRGDLDWN